MALAVAASPLQPVAPALAVEAEVDPAAPQQLPLQLLPPLTQLARRQPQPPPLVSQKLMRSSYVSLGTPHLRLATAPHLPCHCLLPGKHLPGDHNKYSCCSGLTWLRLLLQELMRHLRLHPRPLQPHEELHRLLHLLLLPVRHLLQPPQLQVINTSTNSWGLCIL